MSRVIAFYNVERIKETFPAVIDIDEKPIDYEYINEADADNWVKEIGQKCLIRYRTVDIFQVCEEIFGERPISIRYRLNGDYDCRDKEGSGIGIVTKELLAPCYYMEEKFVYRILIIESAL